ncbi:MAG: hypothetical protein AAGJ18_00060 [Bacteroidota bacterium]
MKKVDKKLLQRYFNGTCTPAEQQLVELWLTTDDYEEPLRFDAETKATLKTEIWQHIAENMENGQNKETRIIPLLRPVLRYAAAACLLIAVFFGGRFSVNANTVVHQAPKDLLYLQGSHGAKGELLGQNFKMTIDGTVRLYNNGIASKQIQVGEQIFTVQPYTIYYLTGTVAQPELIKSTNFPSSYTSNLKLEGGFSIIRQ